MDEQQNSIDKLLHDMRERAKELNCLYQVEELLTKTQLSLAEVLSQLVHVIPSGYQFSEICRVRIVYDGQEFASAGFAVTLSHALTRTTRFQRVGGSFIPTETQQREWPVGNVRWSRTFRMILMSRCYLSHQNWIRRWGR